MIEVPEGFSKLPEGWFYPGDGGTIIERRGSSIIAKRADDECFLPEGYFYPGDVKAYRAMVAQVPDGGRVVEIGIYKGRSFLSIAPECQRRGIHLQGYDPYAFTGGGGEISGDDMWCEVCQNLQKFGVQQSAFIWRGTSDGGACSTERASLDLVMIDGPHDYANVRRDILAWLPKIKSGGIIAGHDYCPRWPGVARAVHEIFGDGDYSCNVNETDYCVMWAKRVGLNAQAGTV